VNSRLRLLDPPAPARRLGLVRALVLGFGTGYLALRSPHVWAVTRLDASRYDPVGVVSMMTSAPLSDLVVGVLLAAALVSGVAATVGWRYRATGPLFALLLLWTLSYRHSWGQVLHTENLLVLHVLVLGMSHAADGFSLDGRRRGGTDTPSRRYSWPLQLMTVLTALTYAIAGWAKIRNGGLDWMTGDVLRSQIAYDNLRKHLLGDYHSAFGGWLTRYGCVFPPLAAASVAIEVGALATIVPGAVRRWFAALAWLFHLGVLALMAIMFPYQVFGFAYLSMIRVERWSDATVRVARRRRAPLTVPAASVAEPVGPDDPSPG
jgi:hypothetical protein